MKITQKDRKSHQIKSIWFNKQFLLLWGGNSISNLTFYMFTFSLPILIFQYTKSSFAMSIMRAVEVLPNLLFGMLIGVIVDRMNKKKVLFISIIIQTVCLTAILYSLNFLDNLVVVYIISFILFFGGYLYGNAFHTVLPLIVQKEQLVSANSSISFINTLIAIVGPSFASLMVVFTSIHYSLVITIAGLLILLIATYFTKIPNNKLDYKKRKSIREDMKEGWKALKENRELWIMTIMILFSNIANGLTGAVIVFYALNDLNTSETYLGIIMSSTGVGALIASLVAKKSKRWCERGKLLLILISGSFLGHIVLFLASGWYIISIGLIIIGFSLVLFNIHYLTLRQESTPIELLGRVSGTSSMIMKFSVPISFLIGGITAEFIMAKYVFLGSAIILLLLIIYGIKGRLANLV